MKKFIILMSMLLAGLLLSAWSYELMTEKEEFAPQLRKELDLQKFNSVSVCCGIKLHLLTEKDDVFYAEGKEKDLEELKIHYKDEKLGISRVNDGWWGIFKGDGKIDVYLSAKGMNAISASSGSEVFMEGAYKTSTLNIDFSSGSEGTFDLNTDKLYVECSSGSALALSGISLDVDIDLSSGSECEARNLSVYKNARVEASSGASLELTSHGKVIGDVSSGSEVKIYGYPTEFIKEESSGGYIKLINKT
ncbi:MAG TPA: DUF2807 domain-containing protein [Saprospiraceae bacterium]|nr:DUF2807 domain-containing protein [Saprospiraceae bacterium]